MWPPGCVQVLVGPYLANDGVFLSAAREASCQNRMLPALCATWLVIKVSLEDGYLSLEPGS